MYIDAAQHLRDRLSHATLTEPAGLCCIVDGSMVDGLDWSLSGNATESALDAMQCRNAAMPMWRRETTTTTTTKHEFRVRGGCWNPRSHHCCLPPDGDGGAVTRAV